MWYYTSPQIVFGEDALDELDELAGERALVVTDRTLVELGIVDQVTRHLRRAGIDHRIFDAVEPDPSLETVMAGKQEALTYQPDWIVGVGGGSAMDAAKAIWVLYELPDMEPGAINPIVRLELRKKAHLVTIPTTSGTGSEVTWGIVLTDTAARRKLSLGNRANTADIAIVDPSLTLQMPRQLTADTGLDALTHAVEGYTCTWHTDMTDGHCSQAIQLILQYLPRAFADGQDLEARERMHNAATLAGLGFGNAMASLAHAAGHALGAAFHVPHGRAVGLLLPYTVEFAAVDAPQRYADLAHLIGIAADDQVDGSRGLAAHIRGLCEELDEPTSLRGLGIAEAAFEGALEKLAEDTFNDASILTSARPPTYDDVLNLFRYAYDGREIDF
jgi:alcohol dehydrogenase class IV